ncbi:16S rRNA (uracil(1498)-N(3))-methyltransferase [Prauserella marina]|uniref:Ribosomal RNA small subunit methyltransferase E n=1 Tax=Prauserella marina TaxID=530584 RepID=A0A222VMN0_9PSEU|nr:16S rRNA (uracil(1498)-N(3))-methyltransferase [Prauserella marina]ASR35180.1 16S rRNA (uracil(1498)-N(3))-methyltransferase [Prauserella marina]PWV85054.1 16S rRNA (uracil1498-N3)-methyltransferase [Prauserella marina]SDC05845.1 16S rRNA (uracil1498-N3)-methyltransferase [Prauserella marina]
MTDSTPAVFLVDALPEGERAELEGTEARHAVTVRRARPGEVITLTDGEGHSADCVIEAVHPGKQPRLGLTVGKRRYEPEPALRVTIVQALAKGDRGELAVELATEAGADDIVPWRAARSVARWDEGARGAKALAKWRDTAKAAAKQARRARFPSVSEPATTAHIAERVAEADLALVLDAAGTPITSLDLPARGRILLIVGPEGGITREEHDALAEAGATSVRLGLTVLRTSTAATVALGALGALTARWQ